MPIVNLTDTICGKICFSQTKNNKSIRSLFFKEVATKPRSISYWSTFVRIPKWESFWSCVFCYKQGKINVFQFILSC